jgi:hypothetical protein
MPDPGLPGAIILVLAVFAAVAIVWFVDRRRRGSSARASNLHGMSREDSLSYFRDQSATSSRPGVQEEDRIKPWGEDDAAPR